MEKPVVIKIRSATRNRLLAMKEIKDGVAETYDDVIVRLLEGRE